MFSRLWIQIDKILSRDFFFVCFFEFTLPLAAPFQCTVAKTVPCKFKYFLIFLRNFKQTIAVDLNNNELELS